MHTEDELLPLSALQHLLFCERQCALIHIERAWTENRFTAEGRVMHERVDEEGVRSNGPDLRVEYALPLRSLRLGLSGKADAMEFHRAADGAWIPFPVEYKRGKPKPEPWDEVQLCAQAVCLEEMRGVSIPCGALFYGETRHRHDVEFTPELRRLLEQTAERLHALVASGVTPPAVYERRKCQNCSLLEQCTPRLASKRSASDYLRQTLNNLDGCMAHESFPSQRPSQVMLNAKHKSP